MAILWIAMSFSVFRKEPGKLAISIVNTVGDRPLLLDTADYTNALGQPFTVSNFKYYISSCRLKAAGEKEYKSNAFFLVNEEDPASKNILLSDVPDGDYTLSFTLGVDSIHNCSGAQSGALDPVNGMFWAWNSGYIFVKLEGRSPASSSPGHIFEYHIGGYKFPDNCIRSICLTDKKICIREGKITRIQLKADAAEILKTPETIDFSVLSSVTDAHHGTLIADNYTDMFSISLIE